MLEPGGTSESVGESGRAATHPYHLLEELGRGGMGVVYRARHPHSGEVVALKTVSVPRAESFAALRREVAALLRVNHPGVVRVLDEGVSRGQPWYAMELFSGDTLRGLLATQPLVPTALTLAARIAQALDFIHATGLVHRDLTPSNVFLRDPLTPVLADFGLASRFDGSLGREILDTGGRQAGTPLYVSPEQIRGALPDARADLYSLGCILYEMLTGTPPFEGPTMSVLWAHVHTRPSPPSEVRGGIPLRVDDLVLRLLEKDPRDRIGYASDVVEELVRLGADVGVVPGPTYLYRPAIIGREVPLARVTRRIDEVVRSRGGTMFLVGESGVGKTRLALEVARVAQARGFTVIESTCEGGRSDPGRLPASPLLHAFGPLLLAVADRCRQCGADETARLLGPGATLLASYEPSLRGLPGVAVGEPPPLGGEAAVRRLQAAMCAMVLALAEREPLMLILDDLQWADELSLAVLTALDAAVERCGRVVVLGILRASAAPPDLVSMAQRVPEALVVLDRLDHASIGAMVADMLATEAPPEELAGFLAEESEGNAFFVVEYLRAAVEAGLLQRAPGGAWTFHSPGAKAPLVRGVLGVPRPLREVLRGRLDRLPAAARRVVEAAAVLGREVPLDVLGAMVDGVELQPALDDLLSRQIIEPRGASGVRFSHDKLREHVYDDLSPEERRARHASAAGALEAVLRGTPGLAPRYADLADHCEGAGDLRRALEYLVRAGERSLASGATRDAAERLQRAHEIAVRDGVTISSHGLARVERLLGQARHHLGDIPGMMRACGSALDRLSRPDVPTAATLAVPAEPAGARLLLATSRLAAGELLRIAGLSVHPPAVGAARAAAEDAALSAEQLSNGYFFQHDPGRTLWAAFTAARFASRLGPSATLARTHATLAVAWSSVPLPPLTEAYLASAASAVRESPDPDAAAVVELFAGLIALGDGALDAAEASLDRAEAIARAHHDGRREREAIALLGNVAYWRGRTGEALGHYERLREAAARSDDEQALAWSLSGIVGCWMSDGRDEEALALYDGSPAFRSAKLGPSELLAHGNVAEAYLHLDRVDEAVSFAEAHLRRFRGEPATGFPGIYGWSGTFDAFAAACAREPRGARQWRHFFGRALVSARYVAVHARVFRVGRAAAARCAGILLRLAGADAAATSALAWSGAEALAIGAGATEGRACVELGRGLAPGARRGAALARARVLFADTPSGYWRVQAERLALGREGALP
ncbi:MAG: protein kinase [Deltaproteobacteria bacterium]|nr:protein kinase [Myxococcales bacterium]MDP3212521.1 protein kinase [Deltaproteobacteria bacterium]